MLHKSAGVKPQHMAIGNPIKPATITGPPFYASDDRPATFSDAGAIFQFIDGGKNEIKLAV